MEKPIDVGVVGSSGVTGIELIQLLHDSDRIRTVRCFTRDPDSCGEAPEGMTIHSCGDLELMQSLPVIFLATSAEVSREFVEKLRPYQMIIDLSSAYRMTHPLIVPEVNGELTPKAGVIANPNCCTAIMVTAINGIKREFGLTEINVSTYQAVSGAGRIGITALESQAKACAEEGVRYQFFPFPKKILFNAFPHESAEDEETGYCDEELKIIQETRKILRMPDLPVYPTCVRIPVFRSHGESITLNTEKKVTRETVLRVLHATSGVVVVNKELAVADTSRKHDVFVSKVRCPGPKKIQLWVCGDQLLKGAALNAVQILMQRLGV